MGAPRSNRGNSGDAFICVVDNDRPVRFAVKNLPEYTGYTTFSFDSGEACLASPPRAEFAIAILDIERGGMNGFALQQQLTAGGTRLPLLLVGACADHALARSAIAAGAIASLRKPIDVGPALEHIAKALSAGARRRHRGKCPRPALRWPGWRGSNGSMPRCSICSPPRAHMVRRRRLHGTVIQIF